MNSNDPKNRDPRSVLSRVVDVGFGTDAEIDGLRAEQVSSELRDLGIDTERGWNGLQGMIKVAQGKARMAEAKAKRRQLSAKNQIVAGLEESKEALIEQIKGLIALSGNAGVFARKWDTTSVADLKSLRDELARTAARAAAKKKE